LIEKIEIKTVLKKSKCIRMRSINDILERFLYDVISSKNKKRSAEFLPKGSGSIDNNP
jgi:hypothetical protein